MTPGSSTSPLHAADRLIDAMERIGSPVCVGLDPVIGRLPESLRPHATSNADAARCIADFSLRVIDAVVLTVPAIKVQTACFERYRADGVRAMWQVIEMAKSRGLEVILDGKRGDIGISAKHYAAGAFGEGNGGAGNAEAQPDWLTINSYLGADAIEPMMRRGRGLFALVRTSNPGGDAVQNLRLEDGGTVAHAVAAMIARLGAGDLGQRGYSSLGAVVGATKPDDAARLREMMRQQVFLVPGYGAQGAGADEVLPCFQREPDGRLGGAIVTASRSVIYAFDPSRGDWQTQVSDAAKRFADEIASAAGWR